MVRVLAFDVFGTVVDWHGSIVRHVQRMGLDVDPNEFALAWRAGYAPAMEKVRSGQLGWKRIDELHRMILDEIVDRFGLDLDDPARARLNLVWHHLDPWPDSAPGLWRLKAAFTICTLSNGNIGLLTDMAKHAALPWDCILSAEVFRHYKPDPQTYLGVCDVFGIKPEEMMMVAAHKSDLEAARDCGCRTAYIERPYEFGTSPEALARKDLSRDPRFDYHAEDIRDLARQLVTRA